MPNPLISARVTPEMWAALDATGEVLGMSLADIARKAISEYVTGEGLSHALLISDEYYDKKKTELDALVIALDAFRAHQREQTIASLHNIE